MVLTKVVKMLNIEDHEFISFTIDKEYRFKQDIQLCNIKKLLDMSAIEITKVIQRNDYESGFSYYIMTVHFNNTKCENNAKLKMTLIKKRKDYEEYKQKIREETMERNQRKIKNKN